MGRFINADEIGYLGEGQFDTYNLYAYCGNNPVMRHDPDGRFWKAAIAIVAAVIVLCIVVDVVIANISAINESEEIVSKDRTQPMDIDEAKAIFKNGDTYNMSTDQEKLEYIRALKLLDASGELYCDDDGPKYNVLSRWSEAEMLREFNYHNVTYNILLQKYPSSSWLENTRHVDFEQKPNGETLVKRIVGNWLSVRFKELR